MKPLLFVGSAAFAVWGVKILSDAQYATHETEALILLLTSAVLFVGAAIVGAVDNLRPGPPAAETSEDAHARQVREVAARLIPASPQPRN